MEEAPWIRAKADGLQGVWHMPAGESAGGILTACDRPLRDDVDQRPVHGIPTNERCAVCQGQHHLRETPPSG